MASSKRTGHETSGPIILNRFPVMSIKSIVSDNQFLINQLIELVETLKQQGMHLYQLSEPMYPDSGVSAHIRHVIEHYQQFIGIELSGQALTVANYDARLRDLDIEKDPDVALGCLREITAQLTTLADYPADHQIQIRCSTNNEQHAEGVTLSSLGRELQFLHSHAVHHMAVIAIILHRTNFPLDSNFGKAPATVQHENHLRSSTPSGETPCAH